MISRKTLLKIHKFNFLIIFGLALASFLTIIRLSGSPQIQFLIVLCLVFFYLLWAISYHLLDKSLTLEVAIEYILTALLALVVAYGVLL